MLAEFCKVKKLLTMGDDYIGYPPLSNIGIFFKECVFLGTTNVQFQSLFCPNYLKFIHIYDIGGCKGAAPLPKKILYFAS